MEDHLWKIIDSPQGEEEVDDSESLLHEGPGSSTVNVPAPVNGEQPNTTEPPVEESFITDSSLSHSTISSSSSMCPQTSGTIS